jgi:integration host factor subunit alpha
LGIQNGYSKHQNSEILESMLEIMNSSLVSGDDILVSGFGKFRVRDKMERKDRNPATGGDLVLTAQRVVTFKCSG